MKSADIVVSILVVCLTLSSSTCSLFDEELSSTDSDGALIDSKPLWIQPTTGSSNELNFAALHFSTVYNGSVIVPKYANGESSLLLVDGATGAVQWEWKDAFEVDSDRLIVDYSYIYKNTFTFPRRGRIYQIDLNSGNTIFKMDTGDWIRRITGLGPTYYLSSLINISEDTIINQGSAYYGIIGGMPRYEHLFTPPYQNTDSSQQFSVLVKSA